MKDKERVKRGKANRAAGARFERKVRADLESKGWIVDKWSNNVEFGFDMKYKITENYIIPKISNGKLIPAKRKFNLFKKVMTIGTGFPDFICFHQLREIPLKITIHNRKNKFPFISGTPPYEAAEIIGCEVKSNGYLDKIEKQKCKWLLDNRIFSRILIASKGKKRGTIKYVEFKEKK